VDATDSDSDEAEVDTKLVPINWTRVDPNEAMAELHGAK